MSAEYKLASAAIKATTMTMRIIKQRFPNLTVEEVAELAGQIVPMVFEVLEEARR